MIDFFKWYIEAKGLNSTCQKKKKSQKILVESRSSHRFKNGTKKAEFITSMNFHFLKANLSSARNGGMKYPSLLEFKEHLKLVLYGNDVSISQ